MKFKRKKVKALIIINNKTFIYYGEAMYFDFNFFNNLIVFSGVTMKKKIEYKSMKAITISN